MGTHFILILLNFVPKVHALREKSKDKSKSKDTTQKISGLHRGIQTGEQRRATSETSNSSGTEDEGLKIYDPRQMQLEFEESRQTQNQLEEENRCLRRLLTRSKIGSLNLVVDDDEFRGDDSVVDDSETQPMTTELESATTE